MSREVFARYGLAQIPRILTLLDRNRHSPTFGCFDRNFWHYKIIDFPSGMAQEFVWPLALVWAEDLPNNPYHRDPAIREWVHAGIRYAARSAHPDGSCDDYFPFERAAGAAAFSLLACVESYRLVGMDDPEVLRFLARRADWLAHHQESGRLTNHHALIVLCLELLDELLGTRRWERQRRERMEMVLSWQHSEGWFPEYEGFDPGYHTLTISCLARLSERRPDDVTLRAALERAVSLAAEFVHPDGTVGGEYGSRNTYNFFPHGFELAGRWMPEALQINDRFLRGLEEGLIPSYEDDHLIGHHTWNYLLAWRDYAPDRPSPAPRPDGRLFLEGAGILVDRRAGTELFAAPGKGGVFKLFRGGTLVASDTQLSLQVERGRATRNAVGHLAAPHRVRTDADLICVEGNLSWAKHAQMTPARLVGLRGVSLSAGRWFPNAVRRALQRVLITGAHRTPFRFSRTFRWTGEAWRVEDVLWAPEWARVREVGIGAAQTSIYVVMSRVFSRSQLVPWLDLTERIRGLGAGEPLRLERTL